MEKRFENFTENPVFFWELDNVGFSKKQTAYRMIVSSTEQKAEDHEGDIWDSQKVFCENNYDIQYEGNKLESKTKYYWSVCVWDERDVSIGWSSVQMFETGILEQTDWQAKWIGDCADIEDRSALLLRKEFNITKEIKSARAYICGLGLFDLKINGNHADKSVLNPANTTYDKTVLYRVFDITDSLLIGENAVGVELGHGFYNETVAVWNWQNAPWRDSQKMLMEITVWYQDGTMQNILSDESFRTTRSGPTIQNSIYYGEIYDANKEKNEFDMPGYDDKDWQNAVVVNSPKGKLTLQEMEPIIRTKSFRPQINRLEEDLYVLKNPAMATGWAKIAFDAPKGTKITITYGETLNDDGTVKKIGNDSWFHTYIQQDIYICKGTKGETFEPKFSYKGYEYIEIAGYRGELTEEDVETFLIHNDVDVISHIETSNSMINNLHGLMRSTMLNNFQGKPTDTPVWEKNGWTGDANISLQTMAFHFNINHFMSKFIEDMRDAQTEEGVVPLIIPTSNWGMGNMPVWNTLYIFAIERLYHSFGNKTLIRKHYDSMRKLAFCDIRLSEQHGWTWGDDELSDWVSPSGGADPDVPYAEMPSEGSGICATGYVYKMLKTMCDFASIVGRPDDEKEFKNAMKKVYMAFNAKYYDVQKQIYETSFWREGANNRTKYRQTSNLLPLAFGLVPERYHHSVLTYLVEDIKSKNYHLDTGMVGTNLILPVLTENGYGEIAYKIITQTTYPSWGFWLEQGATSTWEMYERTTRSRNHYFLGTYDEWVFKYLAGIQDVFDGYKTFKLKPQMLGDLTYVNCRVKTPRGELISNWRKKDDHSVEYYFAIPVGSIAEISFNASDESLVEIDGQRVSVSMQGIKQIKCVDNLVKTTVGSGKYHFTVKS